MAGPTSPSDIFDTASATVTGAVNNNHTVAAAIVAATSPMIATRLTLHLPRAIGKSVYQHYLSKL
jgi:hypothetical protein